MKKTQLKNHLDELCRLLIKVRTPKQAELFLNDLLTPEEIDSVAERLQIFKLLVKGLPQRQISQELKVSISKVTRGSLALKKSKSLIKNLK